MLRFRHLAEWAAVSTLAVALLIAIPVAAVVFALNASIIMLLSGAVLVGSIFGELKDTWNTDRQFSSARVFFRTFEWLSLAIAGYIILSVIGSNAGTST